MIQMKFVGMVRSCNVNHETYKTTLHFPARPPFQTDSTASTLQIRKPNYEVQTNPAFAMSGGDLVAGHRPPSYHGGTPSVADDNGWAPYEGSPGQGDYYTNIPLTPAEASQVGSPAPYSPRPQSSG